MNNDEVLEFITEFLYYRDNNDDCVSYLLKQFRAGYCYHFACILKDTFHRGRICWAAPFGHMVWQDINGVYYDIEGVYKGEALYFIPIEYLGELIRDFYHIPTDNHPGATKDQLINIMKKYCSDNNIEYDNYAESFLENKRR